METTLTTSIEPIEVAFVRSGLDAALDVAAVKGVEAGTFVLEGGALRVAGPPRAGDDGLTAALVAASAQTPLRWRTARVNAKSRARSAAAALEWRLVAAGLLREPTPWRWVAGRRTKRGEAWLRAAQLAYPAAQVVALDPALALALHGPRALDGTRYHPATVAAATAGTDGGGCGAWFAGDGAHVHGGDGHGDGGSGGHGGDGGGSCGGGGCGGGGCGG